MQKIFTERFPAGIEPHQRRTQRLTERLLSLVRQLSSLGAEGLCSLLNIETSDTTLGRLLHNLPLQQGVTPRVLDIDDLGTEETEPLRHHPGGYGAAQNH